jgi:hypothetical protein
MQHLICNSDGYVVVANQDIVSVEATDYGLFDGLSTNVYNNISGAYALCRLFTSYTGPQVRIRRSSDNALVDLYFNHDGYIIDFDFDQWIGSSTGYVVTWYDQGPSGKHTYGYGSTLPFIYRIYENKYVIYFNGTSTTAGGYFDSGSFTLNIATNGGFSSFSCVNFLSPEHWERVYDFGNTSSNYNTIFARMGTSLSTRFSTFQGSTQYSLDTANGVSDNTWSTYGNRIQGSGSSWVYSTRINAVDKPTTTHAVTFTDRTVSRSWIGRSNWSGDRYANMYMACQVFFNTGSITTPDFFIMEAPFSNFGTNSSEPVVGGNSQTFTYQNLSNIPGSSFVLGTWRDYVYETITLPSTFSTSSGNFKLTVTMSGTMRYGPEQYILCGMVKSDNSASCRVDLSAGWSGNQPSWWSYNGNTTYTNAVRDRTTVNNGNLVAGDSVKLMFSLYNSYWMSGHSCTIRIDW